MKNQSYFYLFLSILIIVLFLLISASSILLIPIIEEPFLPMGTIITWLGLIALSSSISIGIQSTTPPWMNILLKISIFISCLWGLFSFWISGNWAFTFSDIKEFRGSMRAFEIFWYFTYLTVGLPILTLIAYWTLKLFRK